MAQYVITYTDSNTQYVTAEGVEYDSEAHDYTFIGELNGHQAVALIPAHNVRSIVRQDQAVTG